MAHKQPSNSNNIQVPSWDEFNLIQEEGNSNHPSANGFENGQQEIGPICEPGNSEEFGPNLPPGFVLGESQHEDSNSIGILCDGANDDFSIPIEGYELDDPEDPLQGSVSAQKKPKDLTIHSQPTVLPKVVHQKSDEQCSLPSLSTSSGQLTDFVPIDQRPCSSSTIFQFEDEKPIGPALPPEFGAVTSQHFDEYDIGAALPPDEPQCSMGRGKRVSEGAHSHRKQKTVHDRINFGPTLPSSSDEEEEKKEDRAEEGGGHEGFGKGDGGTKENRHDGGWEEGEEETVGPTPPTPGKTEEEERAEYLGRLAQFELNKHTQSKELRREEWMTELPQKMLKTGAFGLTAKTSFSRQSSDRSQQQSDLWTNVPNGTAVPNRPQKQIGEIGSSAKRAEKDQWEQQKVDELNKGRNESLLEMHQKKRKIENAQSTSASLIVTESGERKPFDRDREIEGHCFHGKGGAAGSEAKERMGSDLSSRFGHASDRKFL